MESLENYLVLLAVFGAVVLLTAWMPLLLRKLPLSLPIICMGIGALLSISPISSTIDTNPLESRLLTERLTELVVIVSLMGAGLKLDRPVGWSRWNVTWRLLAISMPLTIFAIGIIGWMWLGLGLASALLLGAVLAPTDPVLASDVQVGPPRTGDTDEVRFALTSEAGLNDGLAFPFVYLAVAIASASTLNIAVIGDWLLIDVVWRISVGLLIGWAGGRSIAALLFRLSDSTRISQTGDGFVALGVTCLVYGVTELAEGYGFLAVFVAAVSLRAVEAGHEYHLKLHEFSEQIERLLMMVLLVCFGAAMAEGSIFAALNWKIAVAAAAIVFLVRPLTGWVGLLGFGAPVRDRSVIAFFGIRGLGSFYYLAYALGAADFKETGTLWTTLCCVVLLSIIIHGITVTPVMQRLEKYRQKN